MVSSLTISGETVVREVPQLVPLTQGLLKRRLHDYCYRGTLVHQKEAIVPQENQHRQPVEVERVQTGVRMEKRMLKVLKAVAELKDMTLGDLLEGIVLHAFEGKIVPFSAQTLKEIEQFKSLYGMTLTAADSHNLKERKK
jgi:hypothetical protein